MEKNLEKVFDSVINDYVTAVKSPKGRTDVDHKRIKEKAGNISCARLKGFDIDRNQKESSYFFVLYEDESLEPSATIEIGLDEEDPSVYDVRFSVGKDEDHYCDVRLVGDCEYRYEDGYDELGLTEEEAKTLKKLFEMNIETAVEIMNR